MSCNQKSWSCCGLHTAPPISNMGSHVVKIAHANVTREWRRAHLERKQSEESEENMSDWKWQTQLDHVADIDHTSVNRSYAPIFRHGSACRFTSDLAEISQNQSASRKINAKIWTHSAFHNKSLAAVCCWKTQVTKLYCSLNIMTN